MTTDREPGYTLPDGIHEQKLTAGRPVSTKEAVFGPNPPPIGRLIVYLVVVLTLIVMLTGCRDPFNVAIERDEQCQEGYIAVFITGLVCIPGYRP